MQVFVSSVSNLTDARFFSAYGIACIGFCFDVLDPNAVTIDKAKEIISWLHEPKLIGQFGNHQTWEEMQYVCSQLPVSAIQVSEDHPDLGKITLPKWIVSGNSITDEKSSGKFMSGSWTPETLQQTLLHQPYGICISCTKEDRPGISNVEYYDELMEVLEPYLG